MYSFPMYQVTKLMFVIGFSFLVLLLHIQYTSVEFKNRNLSYNYLSPVEEEVEPKPKITSKSKDTNDIDITTSTNQTELNVLNKIRKHWLVPPSVENYNISEDSITKVPAVKSLHSSILEILQFKKNGFFIECGAFDGVDLSNTLHLEMEYNWTGLLIEVDPINFRRLESKHRKAWIINACLAIRPEEHMIRMTRIKNQNSLTRITGLAPESFRHSPNAQDFDAYCFPLMTLLNALNQTDVDYLSLDIEGAELKVLKTIQWSSVYIKVISVESDSFKIGEIKEYLATQNYQFVKYINGPWMSWIHDFVFVNKRLVETSKSKL